MLRVLLFQRKGHLTRRYRKVQVSYMHDQLKSFLLRCNEVGKGNGLVEEWSSSLQCLLCLSFLYLFHSPSHFTCLCPLQGLILLQGNQVNELPPNPDEPGKHLFEIAPGRPASPFTSCITLSIPFSCHQ